MTQISGQNKQTLSWSHMSYHPTSRLIKCVYKIVVLTTLKFSFAEVYSLLILQYKDTRIVCDCNSNSNTNTF